MREEAPRRGVTYALLHRRRLWIVGVLLIAIAVALWANPSLRFWNHIWAWYHFRIARSEIQRYHNPQAIRHLHVCLQVWPEDPDVLLLAARVTRRALNYSEAERLLEKYQQVRGLDDAGSLEQLLLAVERNVDRGADQCWRYVEQGHSEASLLLEALTRGYLRQYQLNNARACLNRWLESQPENAEAYNLEGLFYLDYLHARSAAEESYRRAVELDSEHEVARLGLAFILLDTNRFADASEHLEYLRRQQPDNLNLQVRLAECRAGLGELAQAGQLLDEVLAQQPPFAPAISLQGRLALESGEYTQAESLLRQAIALAPGDRRARSNLISCLNCNGKKKEAEQQQQQMEERDRDLARFDEIVTKDMLERPRDPALHCALGQLLLRGGFRDEGLRWLNSALKLDSNCAQARQALEDYYRQATAKGQ